MKLWKKIDSSHNIIHIASTDYCVYAREYKPGGGYSAGATNQLILNFKMEIAHAGTDRWFYRQQDVKRFAEEAARLFQPDADATVTAIPSSKAKSDSQYDNRFEDMFAQLVLLRPKIRVEWPIVQKQTVTASHKSGIRDPNLIANQYKFVGFNTTPPKRLIVFDDVLTTGSHFRAYVNKLAANKFSGTVRGVFWARSISPSASEDFDDAPID